MVSVGPSTLTSVQVSLLLTLGRYEMIVSGSAFTSSTIPISFNVTYSSPITATTSSGIGIVGFNTLQTLDFSMNASIVDYSTTIVHIAARSLDTTIVTYMAVHYIVVGAQTYFLEVQYSCK